MVNAEVRIKMVKAMEYIARHINDEDVFDEWLSSGVADGDIQFGDLSVGENDEKDLEYYIRDKEFFDLMLNFLYIMSEANKSGGLYCDNIRA